MAFSIAEAVLKKLAPLAADQLGQLWGLKSAISKLERTVSSVKAVILDAEEQSSHNHQVRHWLSELKEVLYDVDDLMDDLTTEALRKQRMDGNGIVNEVRLFFSGSNQVVYGLEMARAIKEVQSKLDEITKVREQFKFEMRSTEPAVGVGGWRQTDSSVPDAVVGREEDKRKLIDMLRQSNYKDKLAVIPIVGIGGLGKTTLAQLVYNDDIVNSHFELKLWVCVSENFDPSLLIRKVLESATKKEVSKDLEVNTVKELLHEAIKDKRFILVLDDVWNEDREKSARFKNMLSSSAREGSRIVVTTRIRTVAEIMATEAIVPHELQGLSKAESWTLFEKVAFRGGATTSPNCVEIGKEIVGKCRGVPLAIRTMGGLLYFKDTEQEWESVKDKQLLSLDLDGKDNAILATLRVSYDNLPSNLKRCFAYCALFPKDHKIDVKRLVQLWMAQGYIESSQSSFLDDVGAEYFKSLLWRSFFQEAMKDEWGNIEYCKMHDLMHDLAMEVAGKENVVLNISDSIDSHLESQNTDLERIRHVSIGDSTEPWTHNRWLFPTSLVKATKLRTYMNLARENINWKGGVDETIFTKMTGMRALSPNRDEREIMPHNIRKLKHLRYLDLSFNRSVMLPEEITSLVNLQVLKLYGCAVLQQLPRGIGMLSNLMYLNLKECTSLKCMPVGIGKLSTLRELSVFIVGEATDSGAARISELKHLNNLSRELRIKRLERVKDELEAVAGSLKEKKHLQTGYKDDTSHTIAGDERLLEALEPHVNLKELMLAAYRGRSPPSWFASLKNLVKIQIKNCQKLQRLPLLDPLVALEELSLESLDSLVYIQSGTTPSTSSSSSSNELQLLHSLKSLKINSCSSLIGWSAETKSSKFLCLSQLTISHCPKMVSTPKFSAHVERVELWGVKSELLDELAASLPPPTSPSCSRFSSLKLQKIEGLLVLPQGLLPHLTCLESLTIGRCNDFTSLSPDVIQHLTSLQRLELSSCPRLTSWKGSYDHGGDEKNKFMTMMPLCALPCLHSSRFSNLPKFVHLPDWLRHSSNLQKLQVNDCGDLKCLPVWLAKLVALESLKVSSCGDLSSRCRGQTAVDWPNIAHIPNVEVDDRVIQKNGCYLGVEQEQEQQDSSEDEYNNEAEEESTPETFANGIARLTCGLFRRCFLC